MLDEEKINAFLDAINDFKRALVCKTEEVQEINSRIEKLTWFTDIDDACLMLVNDIISAARDLHSSLIRQYVAMNIIKSKGIARSEIREFKDSLDDLRESCDDLELVFFHLPNNQDFVETTRQLSLL